MFHIVAKDYLNGVLQENTAFSLGQTIGTVHTPTKYGTALGSHLTFAMEQNGACKNPMEYIGKAE